MRNLPLPVPNFLGGNFLNAEKLFGLAALGVLGSALAPVYGSAADELRAFLDAPSGVSGIGSLAARGLLDATGLDGSENGVLTKSSTDVNKFSSMAVSTTSSNSSSPSSKVIFAICASNSANSDCNPSIIWKGSVSVSDSSDATLALSVKVRGLIAFSGAGFCCCCLCCTCGTNDLLGKVLTGRADFGGTLGGALNGAGLNGGAFAGASFMMRAVSAAVRRAGEASIDGVRVFMVVVCFGSAGLEDMSGVNILDSWFIIVVNTGADISNIGQKIIDKLPASILLIAEP
mmetsp:Transcript_12286/g.13592  ORF Transcript_12286/g.13592 Transcript_12286/m.13592 type:complete len:288 (-) Transcript_12286:870-1733(-)